MTGKVVQTLAFVNELKTTYSAFEYRCTANFVEPKLCSQDIKAGLAASSYCIAAASALARSVTELAVPVFVEPGQRLPARDHLRVVLSVV